MSILDTPLTREEFQRQTSVSRETCDRLQAYLDFLQKWQQEMNLVGNSTLVDPWRRHILDSWQILSLIPQETKQLVDLGSGAGFPGMILALLGVAEIHLVEAKHRKVNFLHAVAELCKIQVTIHNQRIESIADLSPDVITARALAPLPRLLAYAEPLIQSETLCLFHKGAHYRQELTQAQKNWHMNINYSFSITDSTAAILCLKKVSRK